MDGRASTNGADCAALIRLGTLGAVIGGSIAVAEQFQRIEAGEQSLDAALLEAGKSAAMVGAATAVGGAIAASLTEQGLPRLAIMLLAGSAVLHGLRKRTHDAEEIHV